MHLLRTQHNVPAQLSLLLEAPLFQSPLETEIPNTSAAEEQETSSSESESNGSESDPMEQDATPQEDLPKSKNGSSLDLDVGVEDAKPDEAELERTPPVQS